MAVGTTVTAWRWSTVATVTVVVPSPLSTVFSTWTTVHPLVRLDELGVLGGHLVGVRPVVGPPLAVPVGHCVHMLTRVVPPVLAVHRRSAHHTPPPARAVRIVTSAGL